MNIIETDVSRRLKGLPHNNNPEIITLHHAEALICSIEDLDAWHKQNGWVGVGYHYFVRKDGRIYKGRPDYTMGAHCKGHNANTLGVCAEGNYMVETMPEVQKQAIIELCQSLGIKNIKGHKELKPTDCPGKNYPLVEIKNAITNAKTPTVTHDTLDLRLQKTLNRLKMRDRKGNALIEDGIAGRCTKESIKRFQAISNLNVDGIAGDNTWNVIHLILNKPLLKKGDSGPVVRYLQYRVGSTYDGVFGDNTKKLVIDWQRKNSLSPDGIVGSNTWNKLIG